MIIYNNCYNNLSLSGLEDILNDIKLHIKYATKIIFTSSDKLNKIEFKAIYKSNPIWLKDIKFKSINNEIIVSSENTELFSNLNYYNLVCDNNNINKLGIIIYGY